MLPANEGCCWFSCRGRFGWENEGSVCIEMSWRQFWGDEVLPQLRRGGKALGAAGAEDSKDEKIQGSMAQSVLLAVRSLVPMLLKSGSQPQGDDGEETSEGAAL